MTEPEPINPRRQKWRSRFLHVKWISMLSMLGCAGYMLLWSNARTEIALLWLGATMLFSFGGGQWCRWNLGRLDEDDD
jgi:hypothetical protein